jgi:L-erythrulose 1-phosphate isomerase
MLEATATTIDASDESPAPTLWLGTSWKMTKTIPEALEYIRTLAETDIPPGLQVFVLPAHTALAAVRAALTPGSPILLGSQNAHWAPEGAATGEVSMRMVRDAGAQIVELGHSERRAAFCETDERIARKVRAAFDAGVIPLVCVGEPRHIRESGGASDFVTDQVAAALAAVSPSEASQVLLAYEPIWAIGERGRTATLDEVAPVIASIRHIAEALTSSGRVRAVLYGGSVHADNIGALVTAPGVDGVFVGRAAWDAAGLQRLIDIASHARGLDGRPPTPPHHV